MNEIHNIRRLLHVIEIYGANQKRWPQEEKHILQETYAMANHHPKYHAQMQQALKHAHIIDAMLDEDKIDAPANMTQNILYKIEKMREKEYDEKSERSLIYEEKKTSPHGNVNVDRNIYSARNTLFALLAASFVMGVYLGNIPYLIDDLMHAVSPQILSENTNEVLLLQHILEEQLL